LEILDAVAAESLASGRNGIGLAVNSQNPSPKPQENRGVAAAAERGIDGARAPGRPVAHGRGEDRDVIRERGRVGSCHGHAP